jgi:hypothetical protein
MARSALAEAKINTNPTQPARSRAPAVPDTCPSPGQREARPGVAGGARESVRVTARVVVEMECGILVYPPESEGDPWRAAFTENGWRRLRQATSEAGLAAKLAEVTERGGPARRTWSSPARR